MKKLEQTNKQTDRFWLNSVWLQGQRKGKRDSKRNPSFLFFAMFLKEWGGREREEEEEEPVKKDSKKVLKKKFA